MPVRDQNIGPVEEPRRRPAQQRSRERVERILAAAGAIIAARGTDQLKMSEIATQTGMSLGALYQYFPDKTAIVGTLANRYNAESRACIAGALDGVRSAADLEAAFSRLMTLYLSIVRAEPVMRDIWSGMQADKSLSALQMAETRVCAGLLAAALAHVHPHADPTSLARTALLIWELGEATVRLAITQPDLDGDALVETYIRMTVRELLAPVA